MGHFLQWRVNGLLKAGCFSQDIIVWDPSMAGEWFLCVRSSARFFVGILLFDPHSSLKG